MMSATVVDGERTDISRLDYTFGLLSALSDDELEAVQRIAIIILNRNHGRSNARKETAPFQPQSEDQLFSRIDRSIAQIDAGLCENLDDVVNEMLMEIET